MTRARILASIATFAFAFAGHAQSTDADADYIRVTNERAAKIVGPLALSDADQADRVQNLIAQEYRDLAAIHDARDAALKSEPKPTDAQAAALRADADAKVLALHRRFVARLAAELTPDQVDKVKDGLTYGVVTVTYRHYRELLPQLTDEQAREILANLLEAREYAMDGGSSEEKHAWFGKYTGRINNYLSQAGYDMKAAEKAWADSHKSNVTGR
jgi:hypothetical protein